MWRANAFSWMSRPSAPKVDESVALTSDSNNDPQTPTVQDHHLPEDESLGLDVGDGLYAVKAVVPERIEASLLRVARSVMASLHGKNHALVTAWIVPEPDNDFDPNALRVEIADEVVGYLPSSELDDCRALVQMVGGDTVPINAAILVAQVERAFEAEVYLDICGDYVVEAVESGAAPGSAEPPPFESDYRVAELKRWSPHWRPAELSPREWLAYATARDEESWSQAIQQELNDARSEIEEVRQRAGKEEARNQEAMEALRELKELVSELDTGATDVERIGLQAFRDGEDGRCYLCGAWTDSSDNKGQNRVGKALMGPLFPTDDHVEARSSARGRELVNHPHNIRTAHSVCNTRKGAKPLSELEWPFTPPDSYDEEQVLRKRAVYRRIHEAKSRCYELLGNRHVVSSDRYVNLFRRLLIRELRDTWMSVRTEDPELKDAAAGEANE